jgi:hypothetical protein
MKIITGLFMFILIFSALHGYELLQLADIPTAGILQYGEVEITTKMYRDNGILIGTSVGLFPRFMFGVSYGGVEIVGNKAPNWHERVEVNARYRIIDEGPNLPAVALGFDSQGHGLYHEELKRYDIKSKGFYLTMSRNYFFMGNLGFHLGTNYSMEHSDNQKKVNLFVGLDKSFGDRLILMLDYDLALNDIDPGQDEDQDFLEGLYKRRGNGYLNAALYLRFTDSVAIKLTAYDMLQNNRQTKGADRAVMLHYNMTF